MARAASSLHFLGGDQQLDPVILAEIVLRLLVTPGRKDDRIVLDAERSHVVDLIWQAHIEKRDHGIAALNTTLYTDLAALWSAQQAIDDWFIDWGDALSEADADEMVRFTLIGGKPGEMRRSEIVLHVVNHTSYHRGFVADMFFQIPARPPLTDLPVFLTAR